MAWHKQQQYDPTAAFIQNNRQQKLLELRLEEIDKLWFSQLKGLAKERLDVTSELTKLEEMKRSLQHYDKTMLVSDLKKYTDRIVEQFKKMNRANTRDNFNFDTSAIKEKRLSVSLPRLDQVGLHGIALARLPSGRPQTKRRTEKTTKHSSSTKSSRLRGTRVKSISDSNLHTMTNFKESRIISNSAHVKGRRDEKLTYKLPTIGDGKLSSKCEDHRYLKQKMATTLELPPVIEVNTHRKMSI